MGYNSGGLEEELRISNEYREQYINKDPLGKFESDAERVCSELEQLERALFGGLAPVIEVK